MDPILEELTEIALQARSHGLSLVVVGALAVRAWLRDPEQRLTRDLDLVVAPAQLRELCTFLEERGFRVYESGPWWRGERGAGAERRVIDIGVGEVVDVGSFDAWAVSPAAGRDRGTGGSQRLPVPDLEDVLAMKLLAHRDKDLLDVLLLLLEGTATPEAGVFRRAVSSRNLEIQIRRGALTFVAAASSGALARLWEERRGAPLPAGAVADASRRLQELVG